ncbi:MAG TPA: hypothetical protein PKE06_22560, partial [Flavilitoribacter sp.]|nr:hypothetical protein [Flavilitoribacter sp.]HMQ88257.1 hypothetical protein [Flavilitoribacter sp.]
SFINQNLVRKRLRLDAATAKSPTCVVLPSSGSSILSGFSIPACRWQACRLKNPENKFFVFIEIFLNKMCIL